MWMAFASPFFLSHVHALPQIRTWKKSLTGFVFEPRLENKNSTSNRRLACSVSGCHRQQNRSITEPGNRRHTLVWERIEIQLIFNRVTTVIRLCTRLVSTRNFRDQFWAVKPWPVISKILSLNYSNSKLRALIVYIHKPFLVQSANR